MGKVIQWAFLIAQLIKIHLQGRRTWLVSWVRKIRWRRNRLPTPVFLGFPVAQLVKNLPAMQETWVQFQNEGKKFICKKALAG